MGLSLLEVTVSIFRPSSSSAATLDPKLRGFALLGVLAAISLSGATGCVARVHGRAHYRPAVVTYQEPVYEEPVVYVSTVPVDIESHPRVYYRGSYVYYVDGRWYAPSRRGWSYYSSEPRALVSHRVQFERTYPRVQTRTVVHAEAAPHVRVEAPRVHVEAPRVHVNAGVSGHVQAGGRGHVEVKKKKHHR